MCVSNLTQRCLANHCVAVNREKYRKEILLYVFMIQLALSDGCCNLPGLHVVGQDCQHQNLGKYNNGNFPFNQKSSFHFHTICLCFKSSGIFGWMESDHCIVFIPLKLIIIEYHGTSMVFWCVVYFQQLKWLMLIFWFPLHKTASNITVLSWVSTDRYLTQS